MESSTAESPAERKKQREAERCHKRYYQRKAAGVCVQCGKPDEFTEEGGAYCIDCLERYAEYRQESYRRNPQSTYNRHKRLADQRKADGLCVRCGKPLEDKSKARCKACRAQDAERHRIKYQQNQDFVPVHSREYCGLCARCSAPLPVPRIIKRTDGQPSKLCRRCYENARDCFKKGSDAVKGVHEWRYTNSLFFPSKRK